MRRKYSFKKRKGNIMIVVAIILIVFPSILILASLGGNSLKTVKTNSIYHQGLLTSDSLKLAAKEAFVNTLKEQRFNIDRDVVWVGGVPVYGNYYIPAGTQIDVSSMVSKLEAKESLRSVFKLDNVTIEDLEYDNELVGLINKELPFDHSMTVKGVIKTTEGELVKKYSIQLDTSFSINSDIPNANAYITNIVVSKIKISEIEE